MAFTPEEIRNKLFYFSDAAHVLHLDTRTYSEHKALNFAYKGLIDFRDEISEKLMGYQNGKRIGKCRVDDLPIYSKSSVDNLVSEGLKFAADLEDWAESKKYCDITNIAQALSGLFAQTQYLLTLS